MEYWNTGILEYWNTGIMGSKEKKIKKRKMMRIFIAQHSNIPLFQYLLNKERNKDE